MYNEENIEIIKSKLENIQDPELKKLVYELIEEINNLINISNIDPLTGVYNRRILNRIRRCDVVLMCDIDDFKTINDTYGHDTGDYVLQNLGAILRENTRLGDYVCRLGGDEFLVIFANCEHDFIRNRCEKIKQELASKINLPNSDVTISMGIAINHDNEQLTEMMKRADQALYLSKNNGKNQVSFYEEQEFKHNLKK